MSQDDMSQDDTSQDDVSKDDVSKDDVSQNDVSQNDVSTDDASTPDVSPAADSAQGPEDAARPAGVYRVGFVTFVGRPNVGKSTLTNALVGEKIAITSAKPQTTRRAVRGIVHRPDGQLIIVDTPGIHRPRTLLGERLNDVVHSTLAEVDVIGFCVPADEPIGPGDKFINAQLDEFPRAKKIAVVTKVETVSRGTLAKRLHTLSEMREWDAVIPVSAFERIQLDTLADEVLALMPESEQLYPDYMVTEETFEQRAAELVREAALDGVREELPHSIAVTIEDIVSRDDAEPGKDNATREVYANIVIERDSQKGIMIGRGGERLKRVRETAQREIQALSEGRIVLSLHVRVAKEWQRDPKQLGRLGF